MSHATGGFAYCRSTNGDSFLNRCRLQNPPGAWTAYAGLLQDWANPRMQSMAAVAILVALPFLFFRHRARRVSVPALSVVRAAAGAPSMAAERRE